MVKVLDHYIDTLFDDDWLLFINYKCKCCESEIQAIKTLDGETEIKR